ncbi:TetR family transcriptional regulator [Cryobacterium zongtaii]|uniref:TetR family transcriptional regulator n=1 Tax=Cryobacterium zongtaii TaxID=1259217 RepID=A0A2S3ZBN5_9MICO|nr:TetR/AcrR family transcriptional regulator [Cryobacterium zongtaii]POH62998.1 TetR family transcriptional regulator [Cryobacterium zongtaii]
MDSDTKKDQILDASLPVFCRYGFSKTTMTDIAEAAGVSRAALYLHFNNKEAVFQAGSRRAHATVMADVDAVLGESGPALERIDRAVTSYLQGLMDEISASPHGQELFDSNLALSRDITIQSRQHLTTRIGEALDEAAARAEIDLTAIEATSAELAALILATVEGIKAGGGGKGLSSATSLFLRVLSAAVSSQRAPRANA